MQLLTRQQGCRAPMATGHNGVEGGKEIPTRRIRRPQHRSRWPWRCNINRAGLRGGHWRDRATCCRLDDGHQFALQRTVMACRAFAQRLGKRIGYILDR